MAYLILVRHGESRWNLANKFTGWVDVPLSDRGIREAEKTALRLKGVSFDVAFTSKLVRAHETLLIILARQKKTGVFLHSKGLRRLWSLHNGGRELASDEIPIHSSDRLNERFYGSLQGLNKDFARQKWGLDKVHSWRRSYSSRPPGGESLRDVFKRVIPYFKRFILRHLKANQNVLISAHGNSLRALIKYLDNISDSDIPNLELKTGEPVIYSFEKGVFKRLKKLSGFNRPLEWGRFNSLSSDNKFEVANLLSSSLKSRLSSTSSKSGSSRGSVKRSVSKKVVSKKTSSKKAVSKKTSSKKVVSKKTSSKKVSKKTAKKSATGKSLSKKSSVKRSSRKKTIVSSRGSLKRSKSSRKKK